MKKSESFSKKSDPNYWANQFTIRLRNMMDEGGIGNTELGAYVGVGKSAVTAWKKGTSQPNIDRLEKIAEFFHVSIDYLIGRTDDPTLGLYDE